MNTKIQSKTIKGKYLHVDVRENKKFTTLVIFISGFSGSKDLPLFKVAQKIFFDHGYSSLRLNFCNDDTDKNPFRDALKLEDLNFGIYLRELKNIIDHFHNRYSEIVLVGHSFGAAIAVLFLAKYKKYFGSTKLVFWDQSHLPWDKKEMSKDFVFNKKTKIHTEKVSGISINDKFYKELIWTDTLKVFSSLRKDACIVAAKNSADKDAQKYFAKVKNKKNSKLVIIRKTGHLFKEAKAQEELFKATLDFLKSSRV